MKALLRAAGWTATADTSVAHVMRRVDNKTGLINLGNTCYMNRCEYSIFISAVAFAHNIAFKGLCLILCFFCMCVGQCITSVVYDAKV